VSILVCLLVLLGGSVSASALGGPESLNYMCEDIPPSNYRENTELKGASIELLRVLWDAMGVPPQTIRVVPWARGYHSALTDSGSVLFSMARTPEREKLFKWVGPIFTVKNVLMGLASRSAAFQNLSQVKNARIGLIQEDVAEAILLGSGFDQKNLESVATLEQNFEKLKSGRIDLVAHTESTLQAFLREKGLDPGRFKVYQILSESPNYYAFSRDVSDESIARFQKALDDSRKRQRLILAKYGLSR